jgi:hypothetical protein
MAKRLPSSWSVREYAVADWRDPNKEDQHFEGMRTSHGSMQAVCGARTSSRSNGTRTPLARGSEASWASDQPIDGLSAQPSDASRRRASAAGRQTWAPEQTAGRGAHVSERETCRQAPSLPSHEIQTQLAERFALPVSVSQINWVRATLGVSNPPQCAKKNWIGTIQCRTGSRVLPLSVVDYSVFSPVSLTVPSDLPSYQEALSFSHFRQRGFLWLFMCTRSYSCSSSSPPWCCFGVFAGTIFHLPTHKQAADAPSCTVCSSHVPRWIGHHAESCVKTSSNQAR